MEVSSRRTRFTCRKCDGRLDDLDYDLDLMLPPMDSVNDEMPNYIIPVTQTSNMHQIIDVPPGYDTYDFEAEVNDNNDLGCSSSLAKKIKTANEIFNYMSGNSPIDHPMCQDCANIVIKQQHALLRQSEEELDILQTYLRSLEENPTIENKEDEKEMENLKQTEEELLKELEELQLENMKCDEEIEEQQKRLEEIESHYDKMIMEYNNKKQNLWQLDGDIQSLSQRKRYLTFLADRLKRTNLLDVIFPIWFEGNIASISGLRMGKLPEVFPSIEWAEINAAWGQCVLLLHNVLRKLEINLQGYKMYPCGSTSYIESVGDKKKHQLYQTTNWRFTHTRMDQAMIVFLECLNQVMNHIQSHDPSFRFPYQIIDKYKLTDADGQSYSIKLSSNSDENWTKALKYLLIDLKWLKTWLVKASFKQYCDSLRSHDVSNESSMR